MGTKAGPARPDMVNQPPHYKSGGLEAIDVIEAFAPGNYHRGNALKYLLRAGKKGALAEDLRKAIWYIERELGHAEHKPAPLHPRIEEHLTKMETEGKFAHACPDLDQEYRCICTAQNLPGLMHSPSCTANILAQQHQRSLEPYDPILPIAKIRGTDDDGRIDVV